MKYYKDPFMIALLVFGIVDGLVHPFFITCIMSKLPASIIALQAILYSVGSIISNYISDRYDAHLKKRQWYYGLYLTDFVLSYIILFAYHWGWISLSWLYLLSNVLFAFLGGILTNQNEYIKTSRYSSTNQEETSSNIQKLSVVNRYYNHFAIIIGCGLGLIASYYWVDVNIFNLWLFNTSIYSVFLIARFWTYELWRNGK